MSPKVKSSLKAAKRVIALCYIRQSITLSESEATEDPPVEHEVGSFSAAKKQRGPDMDSPERQKANIQALCDRKGWIPEWYTDAEGHKSGRQEKNRPGWLKLKTRLDDADVVALVANDLSRLHRKGWRVGQLIEWIEEHSVVLALAAPGRQLDLSDPRDRLNASFIAMMDEYYAADIAQRMRDSIAHRRAQGQTIGQPPFGTVRSEDGFLMPSPFGAWRLSDGKYIGGRTESAPPVPGAVWKGYYECAKHILELYATGQHGLERIAYQMAEDGWVFRTRRGKPRPFTRDDVRRVVANWRAYAGLVLPGRGKDQNASLLDDAPGVLYDTGHNVFDLATLRTVAEVQTTRSVTTRPFGSVKVAHFYTLTGILYCAHCECRAMTEKNPAFRSKISGTDKYGKRRYRHAEGVKCTCKRRSILIEDIETDFRRLISLLTLNADAFPLMLELSIQADRAGQRKGEAIDEQVEKQEAIAKAKRRMEAARYLFEDGDLPREDYLKRKEQLEREIAHWEARTSETEKAALELSLCMDALDKMGKLWDMADDEDKQGMARMLFEAVCYDLDSKRIIDFRLKPWADRFLVLRAALYESDDKTASLATRNGETTEAIGGFKGWSDLCPYGGFNPDPAPRLRWHRRDLLAVCIRDSVRPMCRSQVKHPAERTATNRFANVIWQVRPSRISPVNLTFRHSA